MRTGSKLLKVSAILMIVFAAIAIAFGLVAAIGGGLIIGAASGSTMAGVGVLLVLTIISLLSSLLMLIAGIVGVKNWDKPAKAQSCIVFGVIMVVLQIISFISALVKASNSYTDTVGAAIFGGIIGLVLPVLYLVGARKLKEMAITPQEPIAAPAQTPSYTPQPQVVEEAEVTPQSPATPAQPTANTTEQSDKPAE